MEWSGGEAGRGCGLDSTEDARRAALFGLPVLAAVAALAASWQCWINPLIDSGREMDVPWRLLQGERLYRDITYSYGPVGPWADVLALRFLGDRWLSLELACGALSAVILVLLFRLTLRAGGPLSAAAATSLAAAMCLSAPRGGAFLFPYSSSSLFALAGGLLALDAAAARAPWRRLGLGSLGLAVALGSRLELGAAAAAALLLAGLRSPRDERRADLGVVLGGSLLAGGIYSVAFAGLSWRALVESGPLGPFVAMPMEWRFLYLRASGLARPGAAAGRLGASLLLDGLLLAAAAWLALPRRLSLAEDVRLAAAMRPEGARPQAQTDPALGEHPARRHLFAIGGLLLLAAYAASPWGRAADNLPPLLAILPPAALVAALALWRRPLGTLGRARFLLFFWSAAVAARVFFGLAVGPRMGTFSALPLPGLLATAAVLGFDLLAPRLPAPRVFRRRLAALFAVVGALFLYRIERLDHGPRMVELATAAGPLRLPAAEAGAIAQTLQYLELHAGDGDTLTAFPESGFFNFATGLRSPLAQDLLLPGALSGRREAAAARRIDDAGPRYVLLCNRPTPEFGPAAFGRDYAVPLWREVERRYVLAAAFGAAGPAAPVGAKDFFVRVYERRPGAGAPVQLASTGVRRWPGPGFAVAGGGGG